MIPIQGTLMAIVFLAYVFGLDCVILFQQPPYLCSVHCFILQQSEFMIHAVNSLIKQQMRIQLKSLQAGLFVLSPHQVLYHLLK